MDDCARYMSVKRQGSATCTTMTNNKVLNISHEFFIDDKISILSKEYDCLFRVDVNVKKKKTKK